MNRRRLLTVLGGGTILAAAAGTGWTLTRTPTRALAPWGAAAEETDPRRFALAHALLAPNPHNRQPWLVDLSEPGAVTLLVDTAKLLPETDPNSRQITIGLGCFLELMRMAGAAAGQRVDITPFPDGFDDAALDGRPVARATFEPDDTPADPLFAQVYDRRSLKEPFDTGRAVSPDALATVLGAADAGGTVDPAETAALKDIADRAMVIEFETRRTLKESTDLFRIGRAEIEANPDGIDLGGPMLEALGLVGVLTPEAALDPTTAAYSQGLAAARETIATAMGFIWQVTEGNSRLDQLAAGAGWLRLNLAATALGLGTQPLSQALQEYPEQAGPYADIHDRLAPAGGTVQMLGRIGFGPEVAPSPRWPLEAKLLG